MNVNPTLRAIPGMTGMKIAAPITVVAIAWTWKEIPIVQGAVTVVTAKAERGQTLADGPMQMIATGMKVTDPILRATGTGTTITIPGQDAMVVIKVHLQRTGAGSQAESIAATITGAIGTTAIADPIPHAAGVMKRTIVQAAVVVAAAGLATVPDILPLPNVAGITGARITKDDLKRKPCHQQGFSFHVGRDSGVATDLRRYHYGELFLRLDEVIIGLRQVKHKS
jgi:hypothetical protein